MRDYFSAGSQCYDGRECCSPFRSCGRRAAVAGRFSTRKTGASRGRPRWPCCPPSCSKSACISTMGVERLRLRLENCPPPESPRLWCLAAVAPYTLACTSTARFLLALTRSDRRAGGGSSVLVRRVPTPDRRRHPVPDFHRRRVVSARHPTLALPQFPSTRFPLGALGQLMWFRTGLFAMLSVRRMKNIGFGFWPGSPRMETRGSLLLSAPWPPS